LSMLPVQLRIASGSLHSLSPTYQQPRRSQLTWKRVIQTWRVFGPGWPRGDGFVVGYAIAVDGWSGYFPVAHAGGGNLDRRLVERWVKDVLALPADKIVHNAAYDLGWLTATGFTVNGRIIDTMLAAPLLDENRFSYSLQRPWL